MYAAQMETYKKVQKSTMSGREIEAAALTNGALKLKKCQEMWGQEGHAQRLEEALYINQRIWTIFQSELSSEDNPLPAKMKKDLLTLSIFIDKRIFEVMACPEPEQLDGIININLNISAGLRAGDAC